MSEENWKMGFAKSLMVYLNGAAIPTRGPRGEAIVDDSFLLCFNAHHEPLEFTLPVPSFGDRWQRVIDTAAPTPPEPARSFAARETIRVADRAVTVLQLAAPRAGISLAHS
jgi:isoamylase